MNWITLQLNLYFIDRIVIFDLNILHQDLQAKEGGKEIVEWLRYDVEKEEKGEEV